MNRALLPIFLIVAVDILGLTIVLPLLPFYSESLGASPFLIGCMVSVYALCQLISGPFLGQMSDRVGRKPILLISQLGTFLGFVLMALSKNLFLLFLARIIDGITAGNISVAQAYISDVTGPQNRTRAFGIVGAAFGLGFLIGPAISGVLAKFGNHYPIWAAAALSFTSILTTLILLPKSQQLRQSAVKRANILPFKTILQFFRMPQVGSLLWQITFFQFAFTMFISGLALFVAARFTWQGQAFGAQQVGYLFTYSGFINLMVQIVLLKWLLKIFKEPKIVILGFFLMSLGYAAMTQMYTVPWLIFCLTFNNLGAAVLRPAITSEISKNVTPDQQGAVMGVNQSLMSIAGILAPLFSGTMIDHGWYTEWGLAAAGFATLGVVGALITARNKFKVS